MGKLSPNPMRHWLHSSALGLYCSTTASGGCSTTLRVQYAPKSTPYSKHWCYALHLCALALQFIYMGDLGTWTILQLHWQQTECSAAPQPAQAFPASPQNWLEPVHSQSLVSLSSQLELTGFLGHSRLNPCPQSAALNLCTDPSLTIPL